MRRLQVSTKGVVLVVLCLGLWSTAGCGEETGEIEGPGGDERDAMVSDGEEDTGQEQEPDGDSSSACDPACQAYGEHSLAECVDGTCEYSCEAGWIDANEDYSGADEPDPEGDGCEYQCTESNGGEETCDGEDNDCDGEVDEGFAVGDVCQVGQGACEAEGELVCGSSGETTECDATSGEPADAETCNGKDDDCDGEIDEEATDVETWYEDADGDGHGNPMESFTGCEKPEDYVTNGDDCDDTDDTVWKEMTGYQDADGDNRTKGGEKTLCTDGTLPDDYVPSKNGEDCDDTDDTVWKEMTGYQDEDGDGYTKGDEQTVCTDGTLPDGYLPDKNGEDCDDTDDSAWETVAGYKNADGDDWTTGGEKTFCTDGTLPEDYQSEQKAGDCDDDDPSIYPGATEYCNDKDDDCDDEIDEDDAEDAETWYPDCDDDAYAADTSGSTQSCDKPSTKPSKCDSNDPGGWTATEPTQDSNTDCQDSVPDAYPGQTTYFDGPYVSGCVSGVCAFSYDYDCDGSEEKKWKATGSCSCYNSGGAVAWTDGSVPECGDPKEEAKVCTFAEDGYSCNYSTEQRKQKCK